MVPDLHPRYQFPSPFCPCRVSMGCRWLSHRALDMRHSLKPHRRICSETLHSEHSSSLQVRRACWSPHPAVCIALYGCVHSILCGTREEILYFPVAEGRFAADPWGHAPAFGQPSPSTAQAGSGSPWGMPAAGTRSTGAAPPVAADPFGDLVSLRK